MKAKEELQKLFLTEPLKIVIGLLLPPLLVFVASILPQTRDRILAVVRPSLLLMIACAEFLLIGGMLVFVRHLQRERSSLTTELETKPRFRFGIYWDKHTNPLCPSCKSALTLSTRKMLYFAGGPPPKPMLDCFQCDKHVSLYDDNGVEVTLSAAKKDLTENAT